MDKKDFYARGILIFLGLILILYAGYVLFTQIENVITQFMINSDFSSINSLSLAMPLFLLVLGMIIYFIGRHWDNSFKALTNSLVSFAVIFATIAFVFYAIGSNAQTISESIQPSIDYMVADNLDDVLLSQLPDKTGEKLTVLLASSTKLQKIYNLNLTQNQAQYFEKIEQAFFGNQLDIPQKIQFAKLVVTQIYENLISTTPQMLETGIPLSYVNEISSDMNSQIETEVMNNLDNLGLNDEEKLLIEALGPQTIIDTIKENPDMLLDNAQINEQASINLILSENEEKRTITLGQLSDNDINLIWSNLGLDESLSTNTKRTFANIFLSLVIVEFENNNIPKTTVPIAGMGEMIPNEYKSIIAYDIFSQDISQRTSELQNIREDCESKKIQVPEVCDGIKVTQYDVMMQTLTSDESVQSQIPPELIPIIEDYNSIEKINTSFEELGSKWKFYALISLILFLLSFASYYAHFKLFKRELIISHIPYYISKVNLISYIPTFILSLVLFYFLQPEKLLSFIPEQQDQVISNALQHPPVSN